MYPLQARQRQQLLSRPSDTEDGPGQDPKADQGLGVNLAIGTSFKIIGGKLSRHKSRGGEHHCSGMGCLSTPDSQHMEATSTKVQQHHTTWIGQPEPRQQAM